MLTALLACGITVTQPETVSVFDLTYVSAGTSFLIEDVACPVNRLADMTVDLGSMFQKHGYEDASCFGHALEGNLHLVFSQARSHF